MKCSWPVRSAGNVPKCTSYCPLGSQQKRLARLYLCALHVLETLAGYHNPGAKSPSKEPRAVRASMLFSLVLLKSHAPSSQDGTETGKRLDNPLQVYGTITKSRVRWEVAKCYLQRLHASCTHRGMERLKPLKSRVAWKRNKEESIL